MVLNQEETANCVVKSDDGSVNIGDLLPKDPFAMGRADDPSDTDFDLPLMAVSYWICEKDRSYDVRDFSGGEVDDLLCFGSEKYQSEHVKDCNIDGGGAAAPADALFFALGYLGVRDLLSVEMVCRSLRDTVRNDPLLWRNIEITHPLSENITDDDVIRLTNRSQGTLSSLSLEKCLKVTHIGLKQVLESNRRLTKLSVPGCIKLNVEGILKDLKVFNAVASPGIKHVRIGELLGLTNENFEEFKLLLGADKDKNPVNQKPRFYRASQLYLPLYDERVIDIETCPRCQQARQVYDCPSESCQVVEDHHSTKKKCRACICCICRCLSCGCCLDDKKYEETFTLDFLCWDCLVFNWNMPRYTCLHQMASYFVLCG